MNLVKKCCGNVVVFLAFRYVAPSHGLGLGVVALALAVMALLTSLRIMHTSSL